MIVNTGLRRMVSAIQRLFNSASFYAPLTHSLALERGTGSPTFTRATAATVWGYGPTANAGDPQTLLTVAAGEARFQGGRRISEGVWSNTYADGSLISPQPAYLAEGARTNHFLNSTAPATQTSGALGTGTYTLWMEGTGSVAVAGNTATITGAGTATDGNPVTFVVTGAGTVNYTVTGTPTRAQAENGAFASSFITTAGAAVARNADVLSYPSAGNVAGAQGWCYAEVNTPSGAFAAGDISYVGSSPAGGLAMIQRSVSGALGGYDGTAYRLPTSLTAPAANTDNKLATTWGGSTFNAASNGVVGVAVAFDGNMGFPATIQIGAYDSLNQSGGTISNVRTGQRALSTSELQAITQP